jgi:hypothetical protein
MTEAEALEKILKELQQLRAELAPAKQSLGFGTAPKSQVYVFCNRRNGGLWYSLDSQSQPVNIEHSALTGYIRKLEFKETVRRNEKSHKLHCIIEADCLYCLESSSKAHFSKGLMNAIASMTPEALKQPITLVPEASAKNEEVLFCNVYQDSKQIFASYDDQTDWKLAARAAVEAVQIANREVAQAPAMPRQEVAA